MLSQLDLTMLNKLDEFERRIAPRKDIRSKAVIRAPVGKLSDSRRISITDCSTINANG